MTRLQVAAFTIAAGLVAAGTTGCAALSLTGTATPRTGSRPAQVTMPAMPSALVLVAWPG